MNLNEYILKKAIKSGICEGWADMLKTATKEQMLDMYVKGIDFCLKNEFPTTTDLLDLATTDELARFGIYIYSKRNIENSSFVVSLGSSELNAVWDGYNVGQLFVKHTSKLKVSVRDHAFLVIDAFDMTNIDITASGNSKILINLYGQAKINHSKSDHGIIKLVHKNKITY